MNAPQHDMANLFAQLGLPSDDEGIERFVDAHTLPESLSLPEAPFWTPSQAAFLREEALVDADWAPVIDALNRELRSRHH